MSAACDMASSHLAAASARTLRKAPKTPGSVAVGANVKSDRLRRLDLPQAGCEVPASFHDPLKRLPGSSRDRIGIPIPGLPRNPRGHARIRQTDRFPVPEIPGLQLFDHDPVRDTPRTAPGLRAGEKSGGPRRGLQIGLEGVTVLIVAVHHDDDPVVRRVQRLYPRRRRWSFPRRSGLPRKAWMPNEQLAGIIRGRAVRRNASIEGSSTRNSRCLGVVSNFTHGRQLDRHAPSADHQPRNGPPSTDSPVARPPK